MQLIKDSESLCGRGTRHSEQTKGKEPDNTRPTIDNNIQSVSTLFSMILY